MKINLTAYYHPHSKGLQAVEFEVWPVFFHWRLAESRMKMGKVKGSFFNMCVKKKIVIAIEEVLRE